MYLPDPIERGEARAEAIYDEVTLGQDPGKWKCPGCDEIRGIDDMHGSTADPYSSPICGACIEEMYPGAFDQPPGGIMPENDVYNLYDLTLSDQPSRPGDIEGFRVRSRTAGSARACAARHSGREGRQAWLDSSRSTCESYGPARVQWAGLVFARAHGAIAETVLANHRISSKSTTL